jgi:uncharacterized membrane protein
MTTDAAPNAANYESLAVPGEPGVYICARHKNTHTRLRCGRCETPICPKCTVMTPVGARCRDCGTNRSSHIFQLSPLQVLVALVVSIGLGALGAYIVDWIPFFGLFALFYAPAVGTLAGKAIVRATGGKRGTKLAVVSVAGLLVGVLLAALAVSTIANPFLWLFGALAAGGAWYWIR